MAGPTANEPDDVEEELEPEEEEESEEESELEGDEALRACLVVCGLNERQQDAVLAKCFPDFNSFHSMNHLSLTEMVKHIGSLKKSSVHIGE
jgi:hypothetical protein